MPEQDSFYLLRERVQVCQGRDGLRAGMDAVLLGATPISGIRVLELGCGVAPALLCYGYRETQSKLYGVEIRPEDAALARQNATLNGMEDRMHIAVGDFSDIAVMAEQGIEFNTFDVVLCNPPFYRADQYSAPEHTARQSSHLEQTPLADWITHSMRYAKQFGWIGMIHLPERLPEILAAFGSKVGNIHLLPIHSRAGQKAKRLMIFGQKSRRSGLTLLPPLVMHDACGYTPEAKRILEQAESLDIKL